MDRSIVGCDVLISEVTMDLLSSLPLVGDLEDALGLDEVSGSLDDVFYDLSCLLILSSKRAEALIVLDLYTLLCWDDFTFLTLLV